LQKFNTKAHRKRYADFVSRDNRVQPHILMNNHFTPGPTRNLDALAPAGGASSSAQDMVKWLLLELADGRYEGRQLIRKEPLEIARTPQAITGTNGATGLDNYYGFGWRLQYLEDGVLYVEHSGVERSGMGTQVMLLPSQDLGMVALGNAFATGVPEAVATSLLDLTRYGHVRQDWFSVWKGLFDQLFTIPHEKKIEKYAKPPVPNRPPLDLAAYVGTYQNDYVGKVKVTMDNGVLSLTRGVRQAPLTLRHWDGNTFLSYPYRESPGLPYVVEFTAGADDKASQIVLEELAGNGEKAATVTRAEEDE
jgi:hypothetical protein